MRVDPRRSFYRKRPFLLLGINLRILALAGGAAASVTRYLLGTAAFPEGYVLLFALASAFLFVASRGFWALDEPRVEPAPGAAPPPTGLAGTITALRQAPVILRQDANLRTRSVVMNLIAVGFTSIPLLTALAHRHYELSSATVGTFVLDGAVVQISPDGRRALYAGPFGAADLASALLPLVTGVLVGRLGYPTVLLGATVAALLVAFVPVRHLACGDQGVSRRSPTGCAPPRRRLAALSSSPVAPRATW